MYFSEILHQIKNDPRNIEYTQKGILPVLQFHPQAKIVLIGQAPGSHAAKSFVPFDDLSGIRLMDWMGIGKEIFYGKDIAVIPMDFYYPGRGKTGDLAPRKFIAATYHSCLLDLLTEKQCVILIGKYAMSFYLRKKMKKNLTETVKQYKEYLPQYFPIVHPSPLNFRWFRKNQWFEEEVVKELRLTVQKILKKSSV